MTALTAAPTSSAGIPSRPALRYIGGKWQLARWVIAHFPPHDTYVEPFGGGASVLLQKPKAQFDVYNDLDSRVVRFFRVLRERHDDLVRALELTPYSREETLSATRARYEECEDDVEAARRFFILSWQGRGGAVSQWSGGWRYHRAREADSNYDAIREFNNLEHLATVTRRLKEVYIEHDDALKVMHRFDAHATLFYVDPPYVQSSTSRSAMKAYQFEWGDDAHRELAAVLHKCKGMVVLSGYPSALYDELYGDWRRVERQARDGMGRERTECLWLSPNVTEALPQQMSLF